MTTTPSITLTANLESILGGTALAGYLRITLCGFGPVIPTVPGVGVIADAGIPRLVGPQEGSTEISQLLWGNDVIVPSGTFYEVAVLDDSKNVIQCGMYEFTGSGTIDLSEATQIVPPYGFLLSSLQYQPCAGPTPGNTYTAPGTILAVSYNGLFMRAGQSLPVFSYTVSSGNVITLNFTTQAGDRIDALCIA